MRDAEVTTGAGGARGGAGGNQGTSGAGGSGGNDGDASGGAAGSPRDASSEPNDTGAGGRDAGRDASADPDANQAGGAAGSWPSDASDGRGGATGSGGAAGAKDAAGGAGGSSADASSDADAGIADASIDRDATNVDASADQADTSIGQDAGDTTSVVAAGVRWFGRVDTTDAKAPRFSWSGAGFAAQFSGTTASVDLQNEDAYFFQLVVDGQKTERFQAAKGRATYVVANGLAAGSHTVEVYREIETYYGASQFFGLTGAMLQPPPPPRGRLLEFVGDSITAGYGNLGQETHANIGEASPCGFSFATESAYMSYAWVAARALGADASLIAESGWGVYRDRTGGTDGVIPKVYDRILGNDASPTWDFRTKPQAVIINLGTNDFAPGDPGSAYATALGNFVDTVRSRYPAAWIFCAVGTMFTNAEQVQALAYAQSAVNARGGDAAKVAVVDLGSQDTKGTGCDWHPSVAEHQRMADVLVPVLKSKLGW